MRVDKKKNISKITKEILINPLQTQRELASKIWIWKTTVQENLKDIKATKDDRIVSITDTDIKIVELWQREIDRRLQDKEELDKMRTVEISQVIKESTARYSLFKWDATDKDWWLKKPDVIFEIINPIWDMV